ncbi:hypothetical protein D9601_02340 [Sphingomonas sp. MA1305]|uniref:hypothetical protein n=1 Tax=Sphingomonas sp. MA1305 TaxID=2479204 RepID=UPI0018DFC6B3|nr:hypothetical protein [Sphingomonas sp. MA1305]MBI0474204.1 hypothetical protein [Sphingomonas sp. MA1305]
MMDVNFTRTERGGICPDCGYPMQPSEVNAHMEQHVALQRAARLEQDLCSMPDQAVAAFYQTLEVDDPRVDVVAGELERRNIDL